MYTSTYRHAVYTSINIPFNKWPALVEASRAPLGKDGSSSEGSSSSCGEQRTLDKPCISTASSLRPCRTAPCRKTSNRPASSDSTVRSTLETAGCVRRAACGVLADPRPSTPNPRPRPEPRPDLEPCRTQVVHESCLTQAIHNTQHNTPHHTPHTSPHSSPTPRTIQQNNPSIHPIHPEPFLSSPLFSSPLLLFSSSPLHASIDGPPWCLTSSPSRRAWLSSSSLCSNRTDRSPPPTPDPDPDRNPPVDLRPALRGVAWCCPPAAPAKHFPSIHHQPNRPPAPTSSHQHHRRDPRARIVACPAGLLWRWVSADPRAAEVRPSWPHPARRRRTCVCVCVC